MWASSGRTLNTLRTISRPLGWPDAMVMAIVRLTNQLGNAYCIFVVLLRSLHFRTLAKIGAGFCSL